tara:strand:+ start:180 stop:398 length:219 start_codon:yes stop_codon:yes gene_type:complete
MNKELIFQKLHDLHPNLARYWVSYSTDENFAYITYDTEREDGSDDVALTAKVDKKGNVFVSKELLALMNEAG